MNLVAMLTNQASRARTAKSLRDVFTLYGPQFSKTSGCGLYTGISMQLMPNITRLAGEWEVHATSLRTLERECQSKMKLRGLTRSQIKVCAFFFMLRVVFAHPPLELLYGTDCFKANVKAVAARPQSAKSIHMRGLWNVRVEEPLKSQKPWSQICESLTSSVWVRDENPFTILERLMEHVANGLHDAEPGLAAAVLEDIQQVTPGDARRFLTQLILDTQLYLRAANAFMDENTTFIPEDVRNETMDGIVLVDITRVSKHNELYSVVCSPKHLYDKEQGPFVECQVRLNSDVIERFTCLPLGVAHYIFGWQANFGDLLSRAPQE
jgi:hypothetical protein